MDEFLWPWTVMQTLEDSTYYLLIAVASNRNSCKKNECHGRGTREKYNVVEVMHCFFVIKPRTCTGFKCWWDLFQARYFLAYQHIICVIPLSFIKKIIPVKCMINRYTYNDNLTNISCIISSIHINYLQNNSTDIVSCTFLTLTTWLCKAVTCF